MKLILLPLLCLTLLAGCAPELLSSTDKLILVKARRQDAAPAQDVAEAECQKRGMHARLTTKPASDQFGFDCVR
jgi:hypothetical protein